MGPCRSARFEPLINVVLTFDASAQQPQRVDLKTLVALDHGIEARRVVFCISDDDHPSMTPMQRTAWIQPPMRGVN